MSRLRSAVLAYSRLSGSLTGVARGDARLAATTARQAVQTATAAAGGTAAGAVGTAARAVSDAADIADATVRPVAGGVGGLLGDAWPAAVNEVEDLSRHGAAAAANLADPGPRRPRRRVWAQRGHAAIELRGLSGGQKRRQRLARGVQATLRGLKGVCWAEVNAVTAQVLIAFDERSVSLDKLMDAVEGVEEAHGADDVSLARSGRPVPLPTGPIEAYSDTAAIGPLLAPGGVFAATRHPGRTADVLLAGVPSAARLSREGFAVSILAGGNAGEVAFMLLGTALGGRSPLTTRQLLLVNMLTDMFPALAAKQP